MDRRRRRRRRHTLVLLVTLAVALSGCGAVSVPTEGPPSGPDVTASPAAPNATGDPGVPADGDSRAATVTRVVDGDTVEVSYPDGSTDAVRLVGVDAPETRGETNPAEFEGVPDNESGRACLADAGDRASTTLTEWVDGADVTLVVDPETDTRDQYDRLLAYVVRDDANLNYQLVARGYARVYDTSFTRADSFYAAESDARQASLGVWQCADPASRSASDGLDVRVVADAPGNDNENLNGEFVVLTNDGDESLDIGGWTVGDEAGREYTFPDGASVAAGGSVRLYSGSGTDNETAYFWAANGAVWNNDGDAVTVRNEDGAVVARESY
ncbi:micrococcal nuclease [Halomicrobium zhouii]|uniref:Micrococcal nuclease n=1 Tax=Halomicrobium zhouii TaxID=767519 RepID=A0A1I6KEC4_9EURY|nr:lamin tail domain-containing protein [Halomicrobium zhouii]SFR89582.1 micrococcal nuclease [Halomicrobium zhouii]